MSETVQCIFLTGLYEWCVEYVWDMHVYLSVYTISRQSLFSDISLISVITAGIGQSLQREHVSPDDMMQKRRLGLAVCVETPPGNLRDLAPGPDLSLPVSFLVL